MVDRDFNYEALAHFLQQEMKVFDSLHPCIRKALSESNIQVNIIDIFRADHSLYIMAKENPHGFAQRLTLWLAKTSKQEHRLTTGV